MSRVSYLLVLIMLSLNGCSMFSSHTSMKAYEVVSQPQANQDTATALDIVLVYKKELLAQLPDNSPQWFLNRALIEGKFDTQLDIISIEIPPGDLIPATKLKGKQKKAQAVLLYANYIAPKAQQPINVTAFKALQIVLQPAAVQVNELGAVRRLLKK